MTFTPKDWKDRPFAPNVGETLEAYEGRLAVYAAANPGNVSPVTRASLQDLETRLSGYTDTHSALTTTAHGGIVATTDTRLPTQGQRDALAGSVGTPSNVNVFVTNSDPRLVANQPFINVKGAPYNATGDGSTDDRAAIQAAIDAAAGEIIYFPRGVYAIGATLNLRKGTRLLGGHVPAWIGASDRGGPIIQARTGFTDAALIQIHDKRLTGHSVSPLGGSVQGLCLYGNSLAGSALWWKGESTDWLIRDVEVFGCLGYGFHSIGYSGISQQELNFYNCHAWGNNAAGFYFADQSYDHRLQGCVSHNNVGEGYLFDTGCASIQVTDARAEWNSTHGYNCTSGDKLTFVGCITDRNGSNGWWINYTVGGPLSMTGCFTNRDVTAGVRIHASNIVVCGGLVQRIGRNDDGSGVDGPVYGVDFTGASQALVGGFLAGVTNAWHTDGTVGQVTHWMTSTGLNTNGSVTWTTPS